MKEFLKLLTEFGTLSLKKKIKGKEQRKHTWAETPNVVIFNGKIIVFHCCFSAFTNLFNRRKNFVLGGKMRIQII